MNLKILICLSFVLFLAMTMSQDYMTQQPESITREVGQSATIQCSTHDVDIRTIHFYKRNFRIFTFWINSANLSYTLNVSGTYDQCTWFINEARTESKPCTTGDNTEKKWYLEGNETLASLFVDSTSNYRSRIQLSGTIRKLRITLNDLLESDLDSYTCSGEANGTIGFKGRETIVTVVKAKDQGFSTGAIVGIVIAIAIAIAIILLGVIYKFKK